jgi:hypothetical protein
LRRPVIEIGPSSPVLERGLGRQAQPNAAATDAVAASREQVHGPRLAAASNPIARRDKPSALSAAGAWPRSLRCKTAKPAGFSTDELEHLIRSSDRAPAALSAPVGLAAGQLYL